jgi:hypothetical protein
LQTEHRQNLIFPRNYSNSHPCREIKCAAQSVLLAQPEMTLMMMRQKKWQ